ncbi:MAG: trypsin-like peptidase domain-containing protein [Propionibacteriaceae bacterium]|nr:trypsin-like peptidase domain-containing protein [Propionibacteriaceae bacterium]
MARFRLYAVVLLAGLLLASCVAPPIPTVTSTPGPASPAAHPTASLEQVERSVVLIQMTWTAYVHVPAGNSQSGEAFWSDLVTAYVTCTGFFVSEDAMIATAGHCVDPSVSGREAVVTQYLTDENSTDLIDTAVKNWTIEGEKADSNPALKITVFQPTNLADAPLAKAQTAQVLDFQPFEKGDNALLRIASLKGTPALTLAKGTPALGEAVTCIGFPAVISDVVDRTTLNRASFKPGSVSSKQTLPTGAPVTEVSADLAPGMSGGPAVNSAAEVVGINSAGVGTSGGFNFVTDTDDLRLFLHRNGVEN